MKPVGIGGILRRVFLWEFSRGSRGYDIVVILILGFIFLTPREVFRDQPRPRNVALLPAQHGAGKFFIEPALLDPFAPQDRMREAERLVHSTTEGRNRTLISLDPIYDDEHELKGYLASTAP